LEGSPSPTTTFLLPPQTDSPTNPALTPSGFIPSNDIGVMISSKMRLVPLLSLGGQVHILGLAVTLFPRELSFLQRNKDMDRLANLPEKSLPCASSAR
jgi:hypothetical protein